MAVQTSYSENIRAAVEGMIANMESVNLISRTVETAAGIGFGVPVEQGSEDNGCGVVDASTTEVTGITCRERSVRPLDGNEFEQYDSARLMTKGVVWVTVTDAGGVSAGDPVWLDLSDAGSFGNADVGFGNGLNLAGCRWDSSAANGALAKIRVDLSVPAVAGAA